jgi:hypothetical protein
VRIFTESSEEIFPVEWHFITKLGPQVSHFLVPIFGVNSLDDHIVDVGFHILPDLRLQALLYRLLIGSTGVFQAKGHDLISLDAIWRYECHVVLVIRIQGYLVIS